MKALAREMAAPWVALQLPEGTFPDYLHGDQPPRSTRYGEAILGYGLIQTGIREPDDDTIDAGLRALDWFVGRRDLQRDHPSVFANAAVASAYNLARRMLDDHPRFAAGREKWERWLRRAGLLWLPDTGHYGNKYLVDALVVLELLRSGLESDEDGSVLADRELARRRATRLLNLRVPRMADREGCPLAGETAFVLSDPGAGSPIAYHGLSLGFYARALDLLGPSTSDAARDTLREVAHCAWGITGPDGDLSYFGRSQEQAWALALTTYGALSAAAISRPAGAARLRELASRAVDRLSRAHGVGPKGLFITPSLRPNYRGTRGLDSYAAAIGYSGLTLVGLNWAIDRFGDLDLTAAASDDGRTFAHRITTVSPRNEFTVVRRRWWFVVKSAAARQAHDMRYDFGLVALKAPDAGGRWVDVLPARPKTKEGPDSAGPLLRRSRGVGLPEAESVQVANDGTVTLTGGYRTLNGRWLRRGVRFRYEPIDAGVRAIVPTEAGDRIKYSAFFRDRGHGQPTVESDRVFDDEQMVTFHPPATVAFDSESYASGADARLVRANIFFPESTGGAVRVTVGPR